MLLNKTLQKEDAIVYQLQHFPQRAAKMKMLFMRTWNYVKNLLLPPHVLHMVSCLNHSFNFIVISVSKISMCYTMIIFLYAIHI